MKNFNELFPRFDVTEEGVVYRDGKIMHAFNSNNYLQVIIFDKDNNKHTFGVHTLVAMKYLDYFEGCVVHHKDKNRRNNHVSNLEVMSKSQHTRQHCYQQEFPHNRKGKIPWNKGKTMSDEYCKKRSEGAKRRHEREKYSAMV